MNHEAALAYAVSTPNNPEVEGGPATWIGHWKNQMGSTMELALNGSELSGKYKSSKSVKGGSIEGPLKGYITGDLISFLVLWPGGSMTAWTGQMVDDKDAPRIMTLWHLVTDIPTDPDEKNELWQSTLAGADEFVRI